MLKAVYTNGNTMEKGNSSEAIVLAAYTRAGFVVSIPFGSGAAYDLIVDTGKQLLRVQVKTGWRSGGCLFYKMRRRIRDTHFNAMRKYTDDDFDYLAIYDPSSEQVYVVPSTMMEGDRLRFEPPRNNQKALIKWAADFTWDKHLLSIGRQRSFAQKIRGLTL